jgi:hypothetical protein
MLCFNAQDYGKSKRLKFKAKDYGLSFKDDVQCYV